MSSPTVSDLPPPPAGKSPWPPRVLFLWGTGFVIVSAFATGLALYASSLSLRAAGTTTAILVIAIVAFMAYALRRISPVYRAIDRTPPSPAALRDLYRLPTQLGLVVAGSHGALALMTWSSSFLWSTPAVSLSASAALLAFGGATSLLMATQAHKGTHTWLPRFTRHSLDAGIRTHNSYAYALAFAAIVMSGCAGLLWICLIVAGPRSEPTPAILFGPMVAALVAGALAAWVGRRLDADLGQLSIQIRENSPQYWPDSPAWAAPVQDLAVSLRERALSVERSTSKEETATESIRDIQLQKMLFLASTGHDLRSPLNSILGFSELLLSEPEELTAAQRDSLRAIIRSGEELLQLLKDILESARIAAGRLTLNKAWVPAVEILTDAVELGLRSMDSENLRIGTEIQPGLPPVFVDRGRVLQAVGCLLRHAGRSMERGVIDLRAHVQRGPGSRSLRVDVIDAAEGLRPEDKERIFEAFQEISLPSGKRLGGLGLALSLARSLIVAHGGSVSASNTPGVGTTFTVSLPL